MRTAHQYIHPANFYAPADGMCWACGKKFPTRLRVVGHLRAKSRACMLAHEAHAPMLVGSHMRNLAAIDYTQKAAAKRKGETITGVGRVTVPGFEIKYPKVTAAADFVA